MQFLRTKGILILAILTFSGVAAANDSFWVGVKAGTLGYGVEGSWRPIEWLDVRAGANRYDYSDSSSQAGISYDATLALDTYYLTGNFRFPLSPFRLTAGAFSNGNEVHMLSQSAPSYDIGNSIGYLPDEVGTLRSVASFDSIAPYVGAGFDFSLLDRLGLSFDFGVLLQGSPQVSLTADGSLAQVNDPGFMADLEAERSELETELQDLKAYPVISIGFNFNF